MEIKELITRMGGKCRNLDNSDYSDIDLMALYSRFVPERQYVENGKAISRSPWNSVTDFCRSVKTRVDQNFSNSPTLFEKELYHKWFDASVFTDANLDVFLSNLSDYRVIDNYRSVWENNQKVIVSFMYVDSILPQLLDKFCESSTPLTGYEHCELRFDPLSNTLDSKNSAKITLIKKNVENEQIADEIEDEQFREDKLEVLRVLASSQYGLIHDLHEDGLRVSFVFKDYESIRLLVTQGKLFELALYDRFLNSGLFDDVQTSLQVLWDTNVDEKDFLLRKKLLSDEKIGYENFKSKKAEIETYFDNKVYYGGKKNEIDIVMSSGTSLLFVSCKTGHGLKTAWITEINEEARHFHAIPILSVSEDMSLSLPSIINFLDNANKNGISVIGNETVSDNEQLNRAITKVLDGYLVLGKQYCENNASNSIAPNEKLEESSAQMIEKAPSAQMETIKTVKIYIASSVLEFHEEQTQLLAFEGELNRIYRNTGIRFEITISDLMHGGLQNNNECRIEIYNSRIVYFLIGRSVDGDIREEFRIANEFFQDLKHPLVYTFFRYNINDESVDESVIRFYNEDLNANQNKLYIPFDHIDTVKLNIMQEITRNPTIGGTIDVKDEFVQLNGENVVPLKNIPMYQNNGDLSELKQQYDKLNDEFADTIAMLSNNRSKEVIAKVVEIGAKRNELVEDIERLEKNILKNYLHFTSKARLDAEMNWREKKALECYCNGDYAAGDEILGDELWETEISSADEIGNIVKQKIHEFISGKRTLISSLMSRGINEKTEQYIISLFQQIVGYSEKYQTDLDVLYDYAFFLFDEKHFVESLDFASRLSKHYELQATYSAVQRYELFILLGRLHHAHEEYDNAIECYDQAEKYIADSDPDIVIKKAWLSLRRGWGFLEEKEYSKAENELSALLSTLNPEGSRQEKLILIMAYRQLGRINNVNNFFNASVDFYNKSIDLCCSFSEYEKDEELMEHLSHCYNNLGYLYSRKSNDYVTAEQFYCKCLDIRRCFFLLNPSRWANLYALILSNLAAICIKEGRVEEAVTYVEESYSVRKGLYHVDPDAFGLGFAISCYRLSNAKMKSGNQEDAIHYGKQSVEICEQFIHEKPRAFAEKTSIAYRTYAESLAEKDNVLAEESYNNMLQVEEDNEWLHAVRRITVIDNHMSYAHFLCNHGRALDARQHYEIALKHISELAEPNERLAEKRDKLINEMTELYGPLSQD